MLNTHRGQHGPFLLACCLAVAKACCELSFPVCAPPSPHCGSEVFTVTLLTGGGVGARHQPVLAIAAVQGFPHRSLTTASSAALCIESESWQVAKLTGVGEKTARPTMGQAHPCDRQRGWSRIQCSAGPRPSGRCVASRLKYRE